jgi:hypothetical protein
MTQTQRREKFAETHQVATALIDAQRIARDAKTARLRTERLAVEARKVAATQEPLILRQGNSES